MVHYISLAEKPPAAGTTGRPMSEKENRWPVISNPGKPSDGSRRTTGPPEAARQLCVTLR